MAWMVGAGGESSQLGLQLVGGKPDTSKIDALEEGAAGCTAAQVKGRSGVDTDAKRIARMVSEVEERVLLYTHAGGFGSSNTLEARSQQLY